MSIDVINRKGSYNDHLWVPIWLHQYVQERWSICLIAQITFDTRNIASLCAFRQSFVNFETKKSKTLQKIREYNIIKSVKLNFRQCSDAQPLIVCIVPKILLCWQFFNIANSINWCCSWLQAIINNSTPNLFIYLSRWTVHLARNTVYEKINSM